MVEAGGLGDPWAASPRSWREVAVLMANDGWSGVVVEDVLDRWPGDDPPLTDRQIGVLIGDAEDIIEAAFPEMPSWVGSRVPERRVKRVIARMIVRLMLNPEAIRTVQHSAGSFNESTTRAGDHPGELYLTDDDKRDLTPPGGSGRGAFAIRPALRGARW